MKAQLLMVFLMLFLLSAACSPAPVAQPVAQTEPRPLLERASPEEIYFNPVWAPDSRHIYYSHVTPKGEDTFDYLLTLERLDFVSGEIELIVENGIWPRLSPDGSKVAYVTSDPETLENDLVVADADGANALHGEFALTAAHRND